MARMESHDFYCINCGQRGLNLFRKTGHQHSDFHRKKLYCIYCKKEVNHIEIKSIEQKEKFLEDFRNGVFKDEAEASMDYCGTTSFRKEHFCKTVG